MDYGTCSACGSPVAAGAAFVDIGPTDHSDPQRPRAERFVPVDEDIHGWSPFVLMHPQCYATESGLDPLLRLVDDSHRLLRNRRQVPFSAAIRRYPRLVRHDETARALPDRVRRDHAEWMRQGVDSSCFAVNPKSGVLEIGVRSSAAEAEPLLRARYGDEVVVFYANVVPAGGLLRG